MSSFQAAKLFLGSAIGLSKDALHVYVGLGAFFCAAMLFRKPLGSLIPLAAAVAVAVTGELLDMRDDFAWLGYWRWQASAHDVINASVWPFVTWLLARLRLLRLGNDG